MSQNDCVFCKILRRDGAGGGAWRGGWVSPKDASGSKASVRALVIPKEHVSSLAEEDALPTP